jgi:hypothetical protein
MRDSTRVMVVEDFIGEVVGALAEREHADVIAYSDEDVEFIRGEIVQLLQLGRRLDAEDELGGDPVDVTLGGMRYVTAQVATWTELQPEFAAHSEQLQSALEGGRAVRPEGPEEPVSRPQAPVFIPRQEVQDLFLDPKSSGRHELHVRGAVPEP